MDGFGLDSVHFSNEVPRRGDCHKDCDSTDDVTECFVLTCGSTCLGINMALGGEHVTLPFEELPNKVPIQTVMNCLGKDKIAARMKTSMFIPQQRNGGCDLWGSMQGFDLRTSTHSVLGRHYNGR